MAKHLSNLNGRKSGKMVCHPRGEEEEEKEDEEEEGDEEEEDKDQHSNGIPI